MPLKFDPSFERLIPAFCFLSGKATGVELSLWARGDLNVRCMLLRTVTRKPVDQLRTVESEEFLTADQLLKEGAGTLNEADKSRLKKLTELKQSLSTLADEERVQSEKLRNLVSDQNRWSDLAKKLELSAEAREKYVVKITDAEDQLAAIKLDQANIANRKEELQRFWSEALELKKP